MNPEASILISSHNRISLFRRTLWSIEQRPPSVPFEVVIADEDSTDDILGELQKRSFRWRLVRVNRAEFERQTGIKKFWNGPAWTHNVAFQHSRGRLIYHTGNEMIIWGDAFDALLKALPDSRYAWAASHTWYVKQAMLDQLDEYGTNLTASMVAACSDWVLSNENNVPGYLSLFTREAWEAVGGYDERYVGGIGAEDSDFMRRVFCLPDFRMARFHGVSLHQCHGGVNHYRRPDPQVITEVRLEEGVAINRQLYRSWIAGNIHNGQTWPVGIYGIQEVIES